MSAELITNPGVHVRILGLMVLLFEKDPRTHQIVACQIGAIKNVPHHFFSLGIEKNGQPVPIDSSQLQNELRLDVQHTSQSDISFKLPNEQIDRLTGDGDHRSFNWVVDFEGPEVYNKGIGFERVKLGPFLRLDRGEFSVGDISQNHLLKRLRPQDQWTLIGRVALEIRIDIALDDQTSEAVFVNGSAVEATRTHRGEQLDILIQMAHDPEPPGTPHPDDANHYHLAIGSNLSAQEKFTFKSTPLIALPAIPPVTPEASCLPGRMGTTPFS
jgi:hypothetical protein